MAPQTSTEAWDTAWTLTMRTDRGRLTNQNFDKTNTLAWARRMMMEMEEGGKEIKEDVEYDETPAEWLAGHKELNVQEVDIITAAFYRWRYVACPIVIAFDTEMEARKASGAIDVLTARSNNTMASIRNTVNATIWSAQTGLTMLGFQDIIADLPTTGTIGGINRATYSWWRNQYETTAITATTKTGDIFDLVRYMNSTWNTCSDGNEVPDVIFTTLAIYGAYQNLMSGTGYSRFEAKDPVKGIFNGNPSFNGAPVLYDRDIPASHMYFINSQYTKLKVQTGVNFSKTPFRSPYNQLSKVAFIVFSCQLICNQMRRNGVMTAITA